MQLLLEEKNQNYTKVRIMFPLSLCILCLVNIHLLHQNTPLISLRVLKY